MLSELNAALGAVCGAWDLVQPVFGWLFGGAAAVFHIFPTDIRGPLLSALIISGTNITVVGVFSQKFARKTKKVDATLEFNKRYHEMMADRNSINLKWLSRDGTSTLTDQYYKELANSWWNRFFEFMNFQLHFFQDGYVDPVRFAEWMNWRRDAFARPETMEVCEIGYRRAWESWSAHEVVRDDEFVRFLNAVHSADRRSISRLVGSWKRRRKWWS